VRICGHDIFEESLAVRKLIGYLPENPPLYPDMTVEDYLAFAAKLRGLPSSKVGQAISTVVDKCVLGGVRHRIIGKLSKGFQQRVGLAQAMIHEPQLLILDEPTIGLDPIQIIEIRKLIKQLADSHTIILSSHILPEITHVCKRVIIINEGEIAAVDSLEGLTSSLRKSERLVLKVRNPKSDVVEQLQTLEEVISVQTDDTGRFIIESKMNTHLQDQVARVVLDNGWGIEELKAVTMTLEDIFLKLTLEDNEVSQ
jgi:ABC-2 type transport system ATP-binding protein